MHFHKQTNEAIWKQSHGKDWISAPAHTQMLTVSCYCEGSTVDFRDKMYDWLYRLFIFLRYVSVCCCLFKHYFFIVPFSLVVYFLSVLKCIIYSKRSLHIKLFLCVWELNEKVVHTDFFSVIFLPFYFLCEKIIYLSKWELLWPSWMQWTYDFMLAFLHCSDNVIFLLCFVGQKSEHFKGNIFKYLTFHDLVSI